MRRLASSFITLWVGFFVPSLIGWGLVLRWSASAADRFESIWRWTADRLAFPLLFRSQTEWSWQALSSGSTLHATGGFLFLTGLWALMLTLPLVLISGWWMFLASRTGSSPRPVPSPSTGSTEPMALPSPSRSPIGALYIVTILIALVWATICGIATAFRAPRHPIIGFLLPIVMSFVVSFALVAGYYGLAFTQLSYWEWNAFERHLVGGVWFGYLDTLKVPRILDPQWGNATWTASIAHRTMQPGEWHNYMDRWYREPELRTVIVTTAARNALGVSILVTGWQIVRRIS